MVRNKAIETAVVSALGVLAGSAAGAQDSESADNMRRAPAVEEITVTATRSRLPANLESVPGSVTIIDAQELAEQTRFSNDLGDILARKVPGLGLSSGGSYSNVFTTMRGRKPAVFIDGVPATVPLRDGARDMRLIGPGAIGRVDVIRGATAIYGLGAAGGVINYATREPTEGPIESRTTTGIGSSLNHFSDSLNWSVDHTSSGKAGPVSFVASAFYEQFESLFDASGQRIQPDPQRQGGVADTDSYSYYGKVGFDLGEHARLYLSGNLYSNVQDTQFVPGTKGVFGSVAADSVPGEPPGEDKLTRSELYIARYVQDNLFLGSELTLSGYYTDYDARYGFAPAPANFPPNGGQSQIESQRYGVRSDINTPLTLGGRTGSILWGVDYSHDASKQVLLDGRTYVPELVADSYAPFLQLELPVSDWLNIRGGLRYDDTKVEVDTFTTIADSPTYPGGVRVQGGEVSFAKLMGNFGVATTPIKSGALEGVNFYAGFSQGYSVGDFGAALRTTFATSVESFEFEANTVNSYEIGTRMERDTINTQLALFYSTSTNGATYNALTFELLRAPERIWGAEWSMDMRPADDWRWGASVSWVDGKTQDSVTKAWVNLSTARIPPLKTTVYIERDVGETWSVRGQFVSSGRQSRFPNNPTVFGRADVEAYSLLDLSVSGKVGPGTLGIAINNALNERYYTLNSWRYATSAFFTTGPGATLRLTYSVDY